MVYITKRTKELKKVINSEDLYTLEKALEEIEKFPKVKFDETVELHLHLGINVKNSDQMVRGTVILPHGTGKIIRVACFCKGESEKQAKEAGADFVGSDDLVEKVLKGFLGFDVVVSSPDMMRDVSKLGRVLGPRGLMPTPKAGTVTVDVAKAIKEVKAGKIEFKVDKQAGIHVGVGKKSFTKGQLLENTKEVLDAITLARPRALKGQYIKKIAISTTMGVGIKVAL